MRRWTGTLLAALLVAAPLLADEKSNSRVKQFKEILNDCQRAMQEYGKEYSEAKNEKQREAVFEKLNKEFTPRILKLVEADPKNVESFQMLIWTVRNFPIVDGKVYDLLAEHWAKDESAHNRLLCQILLSSPKARAKPLFQKMLAENQDKVIQGYACFGLATLAAEANSKGDKKAAEEAEKYYERVSKDYADVKIGKTTLGEQAEAGLFEARHLAVGKTAPNVESQSLDGKKVELKDYKGKVVVLDMWATWCGPCRSMIPHERDMVKKHKDAPFALISVSADEEKDTLKNFLKENEMPWVHWWDGMNGKIVKGWHVQAFPTIYVLDTKGVIRYKIIGARTNELDEAVESLLDEAKQKK